MSQKIKSLDQDNIKFLCGLIRNIASIDSAINDLVIASDKAWSSKKISDQAIELKHDLEAYVQSSINGLTHLKKKIVDTVPSDADAEDNILYLVKDTSVVDDVVYNQYLLIDGILEPLGSTNTDLSNYYSKDESDAKFALLSSLETLIDTIGSLSDLETTAKDTLVSAINEIKEGLDDCITKDNIVTTLNATCTDEQVPSALTTYNMTKDKNLKTYTKLEQIGLADGCSVGEIFLAMDNNSYLEIGTTPSTASGMYVITDMPTDTDGYILTIRKYNTYRFDIQAKPSGGGAVANNFLYMGQLKGSDGSGFTWEKVCTTSVADVAKTTFTFNDGTTDYLLRNTIADTNYYYVKNGICYVSIYFDCVSPEAVYSSVATEKFPKAQYRQWFSCGVWNNTVIGGNPVIITITQKGSLQLSGGTTGGQYVLSFSYPVAE